jgi:hypothetical protein
LQAERPAFTGRGSGTDRIGHIENGAAACFNNTAAHHIKRYLATAACLLCSKTAESGRGSAGRRTGGAGEIVVSVTDININHLGINKEGVQAHRKGIAGRAGETGAVSRDEFNRNTGIYRLVTVTIIQGGCAVLAGIIGEITEGYVTGAAEAVAALHPVAV